MVSGLAAPFTKASEDDRKTYDKMREAFFRGHDHRSIEKSAFRGYSYIRILYLSENWIKTWSDTYHNSSSLTLRNSYSLPCEENTGCYNQNVSMQLSEFNEKTQRSTIEIFYLDEMTKKWGSDITPIFNQFNPLGLVQAWEKERTEWMK